VAESLESETLVSQSTKVPESTRKPVPEVSEYQRYQKHQSRNLQIIFEGEKVGFSQIQTHQASSPKPSTSPGKFNFLF
jgi:hypothetical protein